MAALVDQNDAVGVAIERNANVGAHFAHLAAQRLRRRGAAILVDVETIRLDADGDDVGAQLPQRFRHHLVGGAVSAIDHHAQAVEAEVARQRALGEFDVAVMHAVDAAGAPEACTLREFLVEVFVEQLLDLLFDVVGQLEAEWPKQLDAIVLEQIMRRRDHDAEIGAHRLGQHCHRRRRHRAEQQHVHADRCEAGNHGVFDHVTGQPCVLADDDAMTVVATLKHEARRLPYLHRQFRRDQPIGTAPNPIGPEIFPAHWPPRLSRRLDRTPARVLNASPYACDDGVIRPRALKGLQKI